MKSDKLTNLIGLYLLIGLVSVVLIGFYFIRPILTEANAIKAQVADTNSQIEALKKLDTDTQVLRTNYESIRNERDRILSQLPVSSEEERLLVLLNDLAQQSGVVLSTFRPDAISTPMQTLASLSIYPVTINASGTYGAIQAFLKKIENGARFVDVRSGVFTGSSEGDSSAIATRISLQAYYQQEVIQPLGQTGVAR